MASTTKTARKLHPAHGDLQAAVLVMAIRYAEAHADWCLSLDARATERARHKRTEDRRYKALFRLTAALANR